MRQPQPVRGVDMERTERQFVLLRNVTKFCTAHGEAKTTHTDTSATSTSWRTTLSSGGTTVDLAGTVSVSASAGASGAAELEWALLKAASAHMVVRAVDLGFGFVGLPNSGDKHFSTHQSKNWCPPRTGCQEWHGGLATCVNGAGRCDTTSLAAQLPPPSPIGALGQRVSWAPPQPLPLAYEALLRPGRSAFTGGVTANASHGYAGWSSQPALPFQSFAEYSDAARHSLSGFASGAARINTNLRCGSVLPVTLKFGLFGDLSRDGIVDQKDAVIWARSQYPLADSVYRHGLIVKLDLDTSYVGGEGQRRISVNGTLALVRQLSAWADNQTVVIHFVGWQGSGHDTLYPSLDKVNPTVSTAADLYRLVDESRKFNTIISYHINTDEAYANSTATSCSAFNECNYSIHPVPGTLDGKPNPDFKASIIAKVPNGSEWIWQAPALSDPLQVRATVSFACIVNYRFSCVHQIVT